MAKTKFPGFPLGMLHFLSDLSKHNQRAWFTANKSRYEEELLGPALEFIAAMDAELRCRLEAVQVCPTVTPRPRKPHKRNTFSGLQGWKPSAD